MFNPKFLVMTNYYTTNEIVFERIHPERKLIVKRYLNGIYYCLPLENRLRKELVYFESELKGAVKPAMVIHG